MQTSEMPLQRATSLSVEESRLWPKGFQVFLDELPPVTLKEREQRQKRIIVFGDFDYQDKFQQLLDKLGYLGIPSRHVYWGNRGRQDEDLDVGFCRQWPRNACTRFGDTIIHRASLNPALFFNNLKHSFPDRDYHFVVSDEWANGGTVLSDHYPAIVPSSLALHPSISRLFERVVTAIPEKNMVEKAFENDPLFKRKYSREAIESWGNRFIANPPVDLDLFMSSFHNSQGKVFLVVDELYAAIYPAAVEQLAKYYTILQTDYREAGNLSCNFIQLPGEPGTVLIPGPSPQTKLLIAQQIGENSVLELPLMWFTDPERSGAIRCRTNIL